MKKSEVQQVESRLAHEFPQHTGHVFTSLPQIDAKLRFACADCGNLHDLSALSLPSIPPTLSFVVGETTRPT